MASKYAQLVEFEQLDDLYADAVFLVSKGVWTSDDPNSGDIFTTLSSYGIRYNELSNNLVHSIEQTGGKNPDSAISVVNSAGWNFAANGGLRAASNGPLSAVSSDNEAWTAAVNFETCRALSSEAWWKVHRKCFDAARAREMSGVVNRMLVERKRIGVNRFGMMAIVYDILNRHWLASDYFKRTNALTCVSEIDKEKTNVTIKSATQAGIRSPLYGLCDFKRWSTSPFTYYVSTTPNPAFAVGATNSLSGFSSECFTYNGKPIPYSVIKILNDLSDVKMNIDMSIYEENKFTSLSVQDGPKWKPLGEGTAEVGYRTLCAAYPPSEELSDPDIHLSAIEDKLSTYGPTYMGNVYLYPVFEPYKLSLWEHWRDSSFHDYIYESEPNPCGSRTVYRTITSEYGCDILFNPQQALWEYYRYFTELFKRQGQTASDAERDALPGDMLHFFEKFCRVDVYLKSRRSVPSDTSLTMQCDLAPRAYPLSPSRRGQKQEFVLTYENNSINSTTLHTGQVTISGNEPTLFQFKHDEDVDDSEWLIWIDAMWVW